MPFLGETESLCPECMGRIPATREVKHGNIYLNKTCERHGSYHVLIWRGNAKSYADWERFARDGSPSANALTPVLRGCPYDCGLCTSHKVNACTMVMEVTSRCDLKCPICFASAGEGSSYELAINTARTMYQRVLDTVGPCTIQLSGGEPTLRDDLPRIISLGRKMGFDHILVNTNGLRLARDREYIRRLRDSGVGAIYLQFDGISDDVYRVTRGANLFELKAQAIDNCSQEKVGVILVPVLIPGVNEHQVGDMIRFAKKRVPVVKGIHFQPVSYLGRYPRMPEDKDRITIPDVVNAIVQQTDGELRPENFIPRGVKDSHCSFSGLFILEKTGRLMPLNNLNSAARWKLRQQSEEKSSRRFMSLHWRFQDDPSEQEPNRCRQCASPGTSHLLSSSLTISCMPFQDVWNIDLERLKGCCGHVVTPNRRIIPFCAFYLTNARGARLYQGDKLGTVLCREVASRQGQATCRR